MEFTVTLTNERAVGLKFENFPKQAHSGLLRRITSQTASLFDRIEAAEPYRKGKLRAATESKVVDQPDKIIGKVRITKDFGKAGALEYGAHGQTQVKAHAENLSHVFARRLAAPLAVMVAAHARRLNIAERRFLRSPLEAMQGEIISGLQEELAQAISE